MKKFLLSLMLLAGFGLAASAQGSADLSTMGTNQTYSTYKSTNGWVAANSQVVNTAVEGSSHNYPVLNGKTSAVGTLTSPELTGGVDVITLKCAYIYSENKGIKFTVNVKQNGAVVKSQQFTAESVNQKTAYTFNTDAFGIEGDFVIEVKNDSPSSSTKNKDRLGILELSWTAPAGGGTVVSVAKPTFELIEGDYGFTLAMAAEEGCKIYYTTDGTEPTTESALYSAPVDVWENTTFKAIAENAEGQLSAVATYNAEVPFIIEDFTPLADAYDMLGGDFSFIVKGQNSKITVVYQNGAYLYVKCGDSYALLYGYVDAKYNAGDTFTRLEGTYTVYNDLPEVKDYTLGGEQGTAAAIEPELTETYLVGANMVNRYITLENVMVDANALTITSEDGDVLAIYNRFSDVVLESGKMNITGFVSIFKGTVQLYPTDFVLKLAGIEHQPTVGVIFAKFDYTLHVNNYDEDYDNFTVELHVDGAKADECTEHTLVAEPQAAPALREAAFNATHKLAGTVKATGLTGGTDYAAKLVVKHGNDIVKEQAADFTTGGTVGIEDVTVEGNEAAEYFNLQGVRVAQPEAGQVYIVRRGEKASKELVK